MASDAAGGIGCCRLSSDFLSTLPETNITPENGWLEYDCFLLGPGLFSGAMLMLVLGGVGEQKETP